MNPHLGARALPDFLIIGAQKSATTSLLSYLGAHKDVRLGWKKSAHFFDLHFRRGAKWYAGHFPFAARVPFLGNPADRRWLTGESCPSYMFLPEVPARVQALLPAVKAIAVLRDPVSRLISQHQHERRKGRGPATFEEFIATSLDAAWPPSGEAEEIRQRCAVPRGFYEDQLRHWLAFFPREQLCVVSFEELIADTTGSLGKIFSFLGLPPQAIDSSRVLNKGAGGSAGIADAALRSRLYDLYRRKNAGLEALTGQKFPWLHP